MLASPDRGRLPDSPDYTYEYKYDGYRAVMRVAADGTMALTSRNGNDLTDEFAVLTGGLGDALGSRAAVRGRRLRGLGRQTPHVPLPPRPAQLEWRKHPLIHTQEVFVCGWRFRDVIYLQNSRGRPPEARWASSRKRREKPRARDKDSTTRRRSSG